MAYREEMITLTKWCQENHLSLKIDKTKELVVISGDRAEIDKLVFETWNTIPDTYVNMKKYAFGVLSIFGSTYLCEQVFSSMNYIKSKYRSRLTDESLAVLCEDQSHIIQLQYREAQQ